MDPGLRILVSGYVLGVTPAKPLRPRTTDTCSSPARVGGIRSSLFMIEKEKQADYISEATKFQTTIRTGEAKRTENVRGSGSK